MWFPVLGGLMIGILSHDWLGRVGLPVLVGLIDFVHFCIVMRRNPKKGSFARALRRSGVSEKEIEETLDLLDFERFALADGQLSKQQFRTIHYALAFIHPTVTALVVSVLSGAITVWCF